MSIDVEKKCPGCNGSLIFSYGLAGGGDCGYYEMCGADDDCGYFYKPDNNANSNCVIVTTDEDYQG